MPPATGSADLSTLLEIDRLNYLPDYILRKADLCTMAHGLEMRAPFLDHRFVAAVLALPDARALHHAAASSSSRRRSRRSPTASRSRARSAASIRRSPAGSKAISRRGSADWAARLAALTSGQLVAPRVDAFVDAWRDGAAGLGEQVLQLVILDESLSQLAALAAEE